MTKRPIVHIEIPTANSQQSAKFYSDLFGWDLQRDDKMDYTMFKAGNTAGGFPKIDGNNKIGEVTIYIDSDDLDADLKNIEAHGGKTLGPKMEVPGFGSMAFFADPTGNRIALWKAAPSTQG